ncbi:PilZ domain-containing protein [Marinilactibacillus sp. XAAS-LB27]|uniref:PilZ domain-containing protein n=1 Tax=Marinilactibacillus sp. XAAS-LB27 TaxID=3114538 RepID=UPI002E19ED7E|nr:PilZ domain-containing protein [Marinilactibacillus sp. XAAS-LB27]
MINRRKFFRVRIKGFKDAMMILPGKKDTTYEITMVDISGNGLSFVSREKFLISEFLKYNFRFDLAGEKFELVGCIVRKYSEDEDRYIRYGVKLVSVSTKEESELIRRINKYQSKHYRDNIFENEEA